MTILSSTVSITRCMLIHHALVVHYVGTGGDWNFRVAVTSLVSVARFSFAKVIRRVVVVSAVSVVAFVVGDLVGFVVGFVVGVVVGFVVGVVL